jgi:hypothetical protein
MVKKKSKSSASKKAMMHSDMSCCDGYFGHGHGMIKLTSMAFILFLITVWPWAMQLVHSIHWGWFLGATVIFGASAMGKMCRHWKK